MALQVGDGGDITVNVVGAALDGLPVFGEHPAAKQHGQRPKMSQVGNPLFPLRRRPLQALLLLTCFVAFTAHLSFLDRRGVPVRSSPFACGVQSRPCFFDMLIRIYSPSNISGQVGNPLYTPCPRHPARRQLLDAFGERVNEFFRQHDAFGPGPSND